MRNLFKILLLTFCGMVAITSCSDDSDGIPGWPWNDNSTEKPDEPDVAEAKPRYIWIDAAANFPDYANSKENIAKDMEKIKAAGFTDIIVDVRPTTGDVLFNTNVVDQVKRMDVWGNSGYSYYERTETWDYLQAFIDEARIQGLKVNASINTFVGGYLCPYNLGHDGVLFRDESKKGWASVANLTDGLTNTMDLLDDGVDYGAKFFNPANDDVQNFVLQLLADLAKYDLDGINVDFESLSAEAADGYLEFIRELSIKCENNDIVLSVDNYVPASYNSFYDCGEQAVFADYIVIMAYDEHYNGSDEGSVASIGFVRQGIEDTLKDVPAEQVILGVPFYTRVWELTPVTASDDQSDQASDEAQSGYTVSSEVVSMSEVDTRVATNAVTLQWLDDCGQYYAEYEHDGKTYKIWVEDQKSIGEKLDVMKNNHLAGASFWKLGYEKNTIWDTIAEYMN